MTDHSMTDSISRRHFLRAAALSALGSASALPSLIGAARAEEAAVSSGYPIDFHVHLDNSTIDKALELSRERGIKFGIVEHAGTKQNKYPTLLSSDADLDRYLAGLEGKPVFKGIQAEWIDWMTCFSKPALARLDYVLTDAMTFPGKDGQRVKLWEPDAGQHVAMEDKQAFMDRYVDWHVEVMAKEPFDILANTSWLPAALADQWDLYWTPARMGRVIDAAVKYGVALEISGSYKLPKPSFLKLAKAAGAKFSFGSNGRYPNMGRIEYSLQMAKEIALSPADMFFPAPDGSKAVQRRKY